MKNLSSRKSVYLAPFNRLGLMEVVVELDGECRVYLLAALEFVVKPSSEGPNDKTIKYAGLFGLGHRIGQKRRFVIVISPPMRHGSGIIPWYIKVQHRKQYLSIWWTGIETAAGNESSRSKRVVDVVASLVLFWESFLVGMVVKLARGEFCRWVFGY